MENYSFDLVLLAPVMNDFIEKLQELNTVPSAEKKRIKVQCILTIIDDLKITLMKSLCTTEAKSKTYFNNNVESIFSEFEWNVNYSMKPYEFSKFASACKTLATALMKVLGRKNCGLLVVDLYFKMCMKLVNELNLNIEENGGSLKDILLFQFLVKGFSISVKILKKFWYVIVQPDQKCCLMLCLNQSFKTLCLLGKVIDQHQTHLLKYLLNRLNQCCNKILEVLFNPQEQFSTSEFIMLMDSCLNKLNELSCGVMCHESPGDTLSGAISSLKPQLDELLCHAMTVSYISKDEVDCNLIKVYSQKVLDDFQLIDVKGVDNSEADISLNADRLSETLYRLEEVVNNAVLNVVLDVFIDINNPLRNLVNKCSEGSQGDQPRNAGDLEHEISAFDEQIDRIMHIGLFAVSCSTDVRKILEIRSCLASLESLEAELITAIVSLYLSSNPETKTSFQFLFRSWLEEITELKNLIDLILDPAAFSKVVHKRITALMYELKSEEALMIAKIKQNLDGVLSYSKKLIKTLIKSMEHDDMQNSEKVKEGIDNLRLAHQECEAAVSLTDQDIPTEEIYNRIEKRIVLILNAINQLIHTFMSLNSNASGLEKNGVTIPEIDTLLAKQQTDYYTLNAISGQFDNEALTPYINKGKLRTKDLTIMYSTPKNTKMNRGKREAQIPLELRPWETRLDAESRSRCCKPLPDKLELENSLDLELTELLDNITGLSDTFGKSMDMNKNSENKTLVSVGVLETSEDLDRVRTIPDNEKSHLGTLMRQKLDQSLSNLSQSASLSILKDSNGRYETPERLNDINIVQQKINFLMEQIGDQIN